MPLTTLLLDAGGVLVFPNWDRVADILGRHGIDVTGDALRAAEPSAKFSIDTAASIATTNDADRGSAYFRRTFDGATVPTDERRARALDEIYAYHMEHNLWEHVPADVIPALQELRATGVTLAIASNANGALHRMLERVGLLSLFDVVCDSWIEGVEKPDPRFFEIVVMRAGGQPATTMHVGDLYFVDVMGARAAGLRPLLLDPHDLYVDFDVERVRTLGELVDVVRAARVT